MIKKLFLLSFIFFSSCGIPDSSSFETLLAPFLIDDRTYPQCHTSPNGVVIEMEAMVYNIELSFSGYNFYTTTQFNGQTQLHDNLENVVASHIRDLSSNNEFVKTIEDTYIIKGNGNLPTVPAGSSVINGYNIEPTMVIITLDRQPNNIYLSKQQYGFAMTAVSQPNVTESVMSNVLAVNAGNATSIPAYCGMTL